MSSHTINASKWSNESGRTCRPAELWAFVYMYKMPIVKERMVYIWYHFNVHGVQLKMKLFYVVCCRLWIWLKKLDTSTSQTPLLTSIFAPWTEVLSESSRVTWKPRDCPEAPPTAGLTFPHGLQINCLFLFLVFFLKLWSVFSKTFHPGGSSSCMFSLPNWTEPSKETWTPETGGA